MNREQQRLLWLSEYFKGQPFKVTTASADASFRSYYRVTHEQNSFILMDAPVEHEDCRPFVQIQKLLYSHQINVPEIYAMDLSLGFILLSDMGAKHYLDFLHQDTANELYQPAIDHILQLQKIDASETLPPYDETLLLNEMQLFSDWFVGEHLDVKLDSQQQSTIKDTFALLVHNAVEQPQVFVHRDYHSRNLMIIPNNPGVIDFQDAVYGPFTYDLASLLKDCYISWPKATIDQFCAYFLQQHNAQSDQPVSLEQFTRWFDLMAVQRHLKAIGIFCRLNYRDGKSTYLNDIPRTLNYVIEATEKYSELRPFGHFIRHIQPTVNRN